MVTATHNSLHLPAPPCSIETKRLARNKEPRLGLPEAARFIQTWLWFDTFSDYSRGEMQNKNAPKRTDCDGFIKQNSLDKFVILSKLKEVMKIKKVSISSRLDERNRQLIGCIELGNSFAQQTVSTLYPTEFEADKDQLHTAIFLVLIFVQMLGETILRLTSPVPNSDIVSYSNCTRLIDLLLSTSGWWQKDVRSLPQDIIFRYYLSFFQRTYCLHREIPWIRRRETCDKHRVMQCTNFTPKHTHHDCLCPLKAACKTQADLSKAFQLYTYAEQALKCWNMPQAEKLCQETPKLAFVAISHVRALGLGNDDENSLPHCQLFLLQTLANRIIRPDQQTHNTPFWLDALGLPIDRKERRKALRCLSSVFSRASAVLVLDPTLYTHAFSLNQAEEAIIRIRYSLWKSRLWTLEEGFYAQKLIFRFSNSLVSLDEILQEIRPSLLMSANLLSDAQSTLDVPEQNVLKGILSRFAADIHMAEELRLPINKTYLQSVLRAGYLLSPRFSHLIEKNEVELQNKVMPGIFETYRGPCATERTSIVERLTRIHH